MTQKIRPQAETLSGSPQPGFIGYATAPIISKRDPTSSDTGYPLGQVWINKISAESFDLCQVAGGIATWQVSGSGTASLATLTGNSGGAISPTAGNINILGASGVTVAGAGSTLTVSLTGGGVAIDSFVPDAGTNPVVPSALGVVTMAGTANQITTTGGLNSLTFSTPAAFIAPGSIASTTTLTGGTGISATAGDVVSAAGAVSAATTVTAGTGLIATTGGVTATGTSNINISGAADTTIGTGGTGAVNIGNNTGGTAITGSETITVPSGAGVGLAVTTAAGTGIAGTFTSSAATVSALSLITGGLDVPVNAPAAGATPLTSDARFGIVTFNTVNIGAGATGNFVINNSIINSAAQVVFAVAYGLDTSVFLQSVTVNTPANGVTFAVKNGSGSNFTSDITIVYWLMN